MPALNALVTVGRKVLMSVFFIVMVNFGWVVIALEHSPQPAPASEEPRESSRTATLRATAGLITADLATGMQQLTDFSRDAAGNMVVCLESARHKSCKTSGEWVPLRDQVPAGRTYVGFRIVGPDGGRLELYWK